MKTTGWSSINNLNIEILLSWTENQWLIFQNFSLYFQTLRKICENYSPPVVLATNSNRKTLD